MTLQFLYSQHFYLLIAIESILLVLTSLLILQPEFLISSTRARVKKVMSIAGWCSLAILFVSSYLLGAATVLRKISF